MILSRIELDLKMREMSVISVEEGRAKYVSDSYLNKIMNHYYPWIATEQENAMKVRLDRWNQLFGNRNNK